MVQAAADLAVTPTGDSGPNAESLMRSGTFQERLEQARHQRERVLSRRLEDPASEQARVEAAKPWDRPTAEVRPLRRDPEERVLRRLTRPPELFAPSSLRQPPVPQPAPQAAIILAPLLPQPETAPAPTPPEETVAMVPEPAGQALPVRMAVGFGFGLLLGLGLALVALGPDARPPAAAPVAEARPVSRPATPVTTQPAAVDNLAGLAGVAVFDHPAPPARPELPQADARAESPPRAGNAPPPRPDLTIAGANLGPAAGPDGLPASGFAKDGLTGAAAPRPAPLTAPAGDPPPPAQTPPAQTLPATPKPAAAVPKATKKTSTKKKRVGATRPSGADAAEAQALKQRLIELLQKSAAP